MIDKSIERIVVCASLAMLLGCSSSDEGGSSIGQGSYPFTNAEGDTVCGAGNGDGRPEVFNFELMNVRIRASERLSKAVVDRKLGAVNSCETARVAMQLFREEVELETALGAGQTEPDADAPIDKIFDGFATSAAPWVVGLFNSAGNEFCSGSMISAHYLLTAGHCFGAGASCNTATGCTKSMTVKATDSSGVLRTVGSGNMTLFRPSNFTTFCSPGDIALVKLASGWAAPFNGSASWARVFGRQLFSNATPILYGYGNNNGNGTGSGILRRTNSVPTVTADSVNFMAFTATSGVGRSCTGDSGGPAMTITTEFPTVAGVSSCMDSPNACPGIGHNFWYTQVGPLAESFVAARINGDLSVPESCKKKTVGNYNYWTCF